MVNVRSFSNRFIDAVVSDNGIYWRLTGVYGEPDVNKRQFWWSNFAKLGKQSSLPWICLGDFNEILRISERSQSNFSIYEGASLILSSLRSYSYFSYIGEISSKERRQRIQKRRNFRFEYMWLDDDECGEVVREAWNTESHEGDAPYRCTRKADLCRKKLQQWSRSKFGNMEKEIKRLREEIENLRYFQPGEEHSERINLLHQELETRLNQKDKLWRQRAKEHWLKEGDRNTTFFHAKASAKFQKKNINGLFDDDGSWITDMAKMEELVMRHYGDVFSSTSPPFNQIVALAGRVRRKLSSSAKALLQIPFSVEDVDEALKDMKPLKSPGPDGFPPVFFHKFWRDLKGQHVNYAKSAVVFSPNTPRLVRDEIVKKLGIKEVNAHEKYLGLPSVCGKKKTEIFASLRERIWGRIQGWDDKTLSKAGKEILIKAVLQAIPSYAMSVFKLPDCLIKEIQSMIIEFWWNKKNGARSIHWASKDILFDRKAEGGMGFRDLKLFNIALLGKQVWRLLTNPNSLYHKVFKARYFSNISILDAELGSNPFFAWRSLYEAKNALKRGFGWRVANGDKVHILFDAWLLNGESFKIIYSSNTFSRDDLVHKLISPETSVWDTNLINQSLLILNIPLANNDSSDEYCWLYTKNKCYSVRSGYHFLRKCAKQSRPATSTDIVMPSQPSARWNLMWKLKIMEKVKFFLWRLWKNALPSTENLKIRGINVDRNCVWCEHESPGLKHVFYECHFARQVWALSLLTSKICMYVTEGVMEWVIRAISDLHDGDAEFFAILLWCLWHARNKRIYEDEIMNPMSVVLFGGKYLEEFRRANFSVLNDKFTSREVAVWRPPDEGIIKVNFDAACSKDQNKGGIGMIARDGATSFIKAKSVAVKCSWYSDDMEALALPNTVDWIIESGFENVIIEGDSVNVISLLSKSKEDRSPMAAMVMNARRKLDNTCTWRANWVRRSANQAAHLLDKYALDMIHDVTCFDDPPEWIIPTVVSDLS